MNGVAEGLVCSRVVRESEKRVIVEANLRPSQMGNSPAIRMEAVECAGIKIAAPMDKGAGRREPSE